MNPTIDLTRNRNRNGNKFRRLLWEIVWPMLTFLTPRWAFNGFRRWIIRVFGGEIGAGVMFPRTARVWQPWRLKIGAHSWIGCSVNLYSVDDIFIGSHAVVSEGAFICTASHDISSASFELKTAPVRICDRAWVCALAIVLPGVTVGEGAVVAAGAVVAKNVPPWTVVGGNPAHEIGRREVTRK